MARDEHQIKIRFPDDMVEAIRASAKANGRSMNAEIVALLRAGDRPSAPVDLRDQFAGQALAGILAGGFASTVPHDDVNGGADAAFFAYQYADAMLARKGGAA